MSSSILNVKNLFTSGDSYGDLLLTHWWLVCRSTEHHYLLTELAVKDSPCKSVLYSLSMTSDSIVYMSWHRFSDPLNHISRKGQCNLDYFFFENCLKVFLVRFLITTSSLSFLPIRWKTFSKGLRSDELLHLISSLDILHGMLDCLVDPRRTIKVE